MEPTIPHRDADGFGALFSEFTEQARRRVRAELREEGQQAPGGTGRSNQEASDTSSVTASHIETTRLEDSGKTR
ncbi:MULTISPECIES: hypothetical protein [Myxococcus]|nr:MULTISPECIES: hypothetical protein [Myxococcus]NOJ51833.1 hypothetical protein [Myxococcus xanthus]QPM81214.1 hypothetical protein I5Q59_07910 [Myxococcus xanthus]QVW70273.1 hypothetical protein JTM82_12200 [Myxococcus xanthus DZ2]QZZ49111.1 hypothetical protein MyxoNM_07865 [Myxococcus xanthus]UEO03597.1 hypothetical protein K1515_30610 [Myxococcus xanthus DZ2]